MKLAVVAATGGVGRHALEQALSAGHEVTAIVRSPEKLTRHVRSFKTDLSHADLDTLEAGFEGTDAIISCLGARSKDDAGITSRGTRAIIQAMNAVGVRRVVAISSSVVSTVPSPGRPNPPKFDPGDGAFIRYLLNPVLKRSLSWIYTDLAIMEDFLRDSGVDWTVVRPARLVEKPLNGGYRTAIGQNVRGASISRADVAHLMLKVINQRETIGKTVGVAH
jgi:putative NADH-flavin reductase